MEKNNSLGQQQKKSAILRNKLALLQEFYRLTDLMQGTLSSENMEEFNAQIEQRKKLIESINGLNNELATRCNANEILSIETKSNETKELESKIKECLTQIREIDQKLQQDLKQNYNNLIKALSTLRVNRQAMVNYFKKNKQPYAFFIDKKR